jgi:hypothetical protein
LEFSITLPVVVVGPAPACESPVYQDFSSLHPR